MSAIAWYTGQEKWTDKAECVDPMIRTLCIRVNDWLSSDAERERIIGPILFAPMGTKDDSLRIPRLERIVGFAMEQAGIKEFAGVCKQKDWANAAADAADANAANATYAADAAANAAATYAAAAANAAATYAADAAYATYAIISLILELCAMGEKREVPQVRSLKDLV